MSIQEGVTKSEKGIIGIIVKITKEEQKQLEELGDTKGFIIKDIKLLDKTIGLLEIKALLVKDKNCKTTRGKFSITLMIVAYSGDDISNNVTIEYNVSKEMAHKILFNTHQIFNAADGKKFSIKIVKE